MSIEFLRDVERDLSAIGVEALLLGDPIVEQILRVMEKIDREADRLIREASNPAPAPFCLECGATTVELEAIAPGKHVCLGCLNSGGLGDAHNLCPNCHERSGLNSLNGCGPCRSFVEAWAAGEFDERKDSPEDRLPKCDACGEALSAGHTAGCPKCEAYADSCYDAHVGGWL